MITKINNFVDKNKNSILIIASIVFVLFYFMYSVTILWDSAHYMTYVSILEGVNEWNTWDVVRGPVFPLLIFLSNILFGKTVQGLLILTFIFYSVMLLIVYKILNKILNNNKYKNVLMIVIILLIIINPIIYGYYHALLTEFVAITLSILTCYLSWKYIEEIDYNWKFYKKVLYILFFGFLIIFSWYLKQPYVSTTLFPILIAMILSIFNNFSLKNILSKLAIIIFCFISLIIGIKGWNMFLNSKNINTNIDRNPTTTFSEGLINTIKNVDVVSSDKYTLFDVQNMLLSTEEKKVISNIIKNDGQFKIINITKDKKIIEQYFYETSTIGFKDSIIFMVKLLLKHPTLVVDTYFTNYLSISDIYGTTTSDGVAYYSTGKLDIKFCSEICTIGYKPYNYTSNIFYMTEDRFELVKNYEQANYTPKIINFGMRKLGILYLFTYKITMILLPFSLIFSIIYKIINRKKINIKGLDLVIILLGYSLLHILVHIVSGAFIDRYATPAYLTSMLGIGILIYTIIINKKVKVRKK